MEDKDKPICNFCGKNSAEVAQLVKGDYNSFICSTCIGTCCEIITDKGIVRESEIDYLVKLTVAEMQRSKRKNIKECVKEATDGFTEIIQQARKYHPANIHNPMHKNAEEVVDKKYTQK